MSGRARLERVDLAREGAGRLLTLPRGSVSAHVVLALDGLEALDRDGQDALADLLETASPRLVSATRVDPESLAATWREDLLGLLSTVTVHAPALRERAEEIPQLAEQRIAMLCEELALERPPELGTGAAAALASHDWPGDVTEFDAVLLGTLLREPLPARIEPGDLAWRRVAPARPSAPGDGSPVRPNEEPPRPSPGPPSPPAPSSDPLDSLESVAVELAHQLKNPLVTVKTFIANADRMEDEELARFREIALRGIDRIDGPLELILDFSRLESSTDDLLEVSSALARALAGHASEFEEKGVRIHGVPPTALQARGAEANLEFALSALCRHVADTVEPHSALAVSRPSADQILLRYRESATAAHLRSATGDPDSSFPLALLLVRGALTRMGGGLRTSHGQNEVTIELSFTAA